MNVKDINELIEKTYSENKDTLRNTSYDCENKEYLCDSTKMAFNYDEIIKKVYINKDRPQTPDAIYIDNKINFIEFKNGTIKNTEKVLKLRLKAIEGLYNFEKYIVNKDNDNISDNLRYIVVYNESKNPAQQQKNIIIKHLGNKANKRIIRFNLERFEGTYFSEVLTLTGDEFKKEFLKETS